MTINHHKRFNTTRRMRLTGYNYGSPGFYFLTWCQRDRLPLFVDESNQGWNLTPAGEMIDSAIKEMASRFHDITIDEYAVMPNHIHLLVGLSTTLDAREADSVIEAIHWLKTVTTNRYIKGVKAMNWPRFNKTLWQEGYHDRNVRDERELEAVRGYINENPTRWREDEFY